MLVVHDEGHRAHDPRTFILRGAVVQSPEQPRRADVLLEAARRAGHEVVPPHTVSLDALERVHDAGYLTWLETAHAAWSALPGAAPEITPNIHPSRNMAADSPHPVAQAGRYTADTACPVGAGTWAGALASARIALSLADRVADGLDHGYALCRPPGHHAFADMAGGFCFLNNTAIAAQHLIERGAGRVAVLDVDVHHGNGTQGIFWRRGDVLTVSLHGDPREFYPFYLGHAGESGEGAGEGANLNLPLPRGTADEAYLEALGSALARVDAFGADVLVVALGLDASATDPLAFTAVTTDGFRRIGERLGRVRRPLCLVQEGGYLQPALADNLAAVLAGVASAR